MKPSPLRTGIALTFLTLPWAATSIAEPRAAGERPEGFLGVVISRQAVDLAPTFEGKLSEVRVRMGESVRRGQTLARLEDESTRQELARARADLEEARASRDEAEAKLNMAHEIQARRSRLPGIVSEEDLHEAVEQERLALAGVERAEATIRRHEALVRQLEDRLDQTTIKAPFDGTVATRYREPGMTADPNTPVLRLIGSDTLWIRFAVPADEAQDVEPGGRIRVIVPTLDAVIPGTIEQIASEIDAASGMLFCEAILLPETPWTGSPLPGRTARVLVGGE